MRTVIGLFGNTGEAQRTIDDLKKIGASTENISILSRSGTSRLGDMTLSPVEVRGIGSMAACGPMTTFLTRATAENQPDAMVGALINMGLKQSDAERYVAAVRSGYMLEAVSVEDDDAEKALEIMRDHVNRDTAVRASTNIEGSTGPSREVISKNIGKIASTGKEEAILPVVAEELAVGKREVSSGGVRATTHVTETPVEEQVSLRQERVDVERRPVDRAVSGTEQPFRDQTIEVVATSEEPIVEKKARVVEEVVVKKGVDTRTETIRDTVRKTDVDVQPFEPSKYQEHFRELQLGGKEKFEDYTPAYRFGNELSYDERYSGKDWPYVESNARSEWEQKNPGTWDRFKGAIRHAWNRASGKG